MTQLKRLIDDPGSDLDRVLLEAGLDEQPPKASLDRTLVALGVGSATAIGAGAIGASGVGASLGGAKSLFGAGIAKWVGGALLASAAIGGGYYVTRTAEAPVAAVAPAATQAFEQGERSSELRGAPVLGSPSPEATDKAAAAESKNEGLPAPAVPEAKAPETKASEAKASQAKASEAKTSEKPQVAKTDVAKPDVAKPEKAQPDLTAGGGSLSDELRMLDTARKALLAGDNDACLANLAKYSSKFPKGQMASDAQAMKASCAAKKPAAAP